MYGHGEDRIRTYKGSDIRAKSEGRSITCKLQAHTPTRLLTQHLYFYSSPMSKNSSNASSPFLSDVPHAPTPSNNATSSSGTVQKNDSGLRRATNTNTSPSPPAPRRSHLLSSKCALRTSTGTIVNHSPNADQKVASLDNKRILYEMTT